MLFDRADYALRPVGLGKTLDGVVGMPRPSVPVRAVGEAKLTVQAMKVRHCWCYESAFQSSPDVVVGWCIFPHATERVREIALKEPGWCHRAAPVCYLEQRV